MRGKGKFEKDSRSPGSFLPGDLSRRIIALLFVVFALAFIAGISGFLEKGKSFDNAFYATMQLVVLEADLLLAALENGDLEIGSQLQIARFVLPLLMGLAIFLLLVRFIGERLTWLQLKVFPRKIVFLGTGRMASGIASNLDKIVNTAAMDRDIDQKYAQRLSEQSSGKLIEGNVNSTKSLTLLNLARADDIYIFTGDDMQDIEVARKAIGLILKKKGKMLRHEGEKNPRITRPRLIVDIDDKELLRVAVHDPIFQKYRNEGGEIVWFSALAQAARMLFLTYPPDDVPSQERNAPLHIGLVGFGPFAREVLLQAVRHCVYIDERPIRISIFAENRVEFDQFLARYPMLDPGNKDEPSYNNMMPLASLAFYHYSPESIAPAILRQAMEGVAPLDKIYVTAEHDYASLSSGQRFVSILAALEVAADVICCLPGTHFLNQEEANEVKRDINVQPECLVVKEQKSTPTKESPYKDVCFFHQVTDSLHKKESYPGEISDRVGIMVDAAYQKSHLIGAGDEKSLALFEKEMNEALMYTKQGWKTNLPDDFRCSSRHSGDHIFVKLRELGFVLEEVPHSSETWSLGKKICSLTGGLIGKKNVNNYLLSGPKTSLDRPCAENRSPMVDELMVELLKSIKDCQNNGNLSQLEHRRFCAERLIDGWLYAKEKKNYLQLNPTLMLFEKLKEDETNKDNAIILAIPSIVRHQEISCHYMLARRRRKGQHESASHAEQVTA